MTWREMQEELETQGYVEQAPSAYVAALDRKICEELVCECLEGKMEYRPFQRPGSYRAFCVCPQCEYWEEI